MANTRTKRQCNSCGGIYFTHGEDGVPYFHACPTEIIDQHAVCDPKTGDVITPATFKPTPNPRNENLVLVDINTNEHRIIAEGSGFRELP
jgi:hypothetical protein